VQPLDVMNQNNSPGRHGRPIMGSVLIWARRFRRHDLSQNPPTEQPITKKDAQDCIKTVTLIAAHIHGLKLS